MTLEVYTEALCYQVAADEWDRFTLHVVQAGRWSWFPKIREILDALDEFKGQPSIDVEAAHRYELVLQSGTYSAESGTVWNYRVVAERCGRAAAEAFMAAGGPNAFATSWNEAKRREAFLSAYQLAAREDAAARQLPAPKERAALAPGEHVDPRLTAGEAKGFLDEIRARLPEPSSMPSPRAETITVVATPERMAMLKAQAAQLLADSEVKADAL